MGRRSLEDEIVRRWRSQSRAGRGRGSDGGEQSAESGEQDNDPQNQRTPTPLADRLRGRVPDRILDDPRWHVAEDQFAVLTAQGADPETLIESVAAIDFNNGQIRAPSGYAAWAMREAAKNGKVTNAHTRSEEDARRSVAEEWLATADPKSPFDRARAAQLVGEIDDDFDALLARKYPGILDGDADQAREQAASHEGAADDQARKDATSAQAADAEENTVFVVDSDGTVITVSFAEAPEPEPQAEAEAEAEAADHSAESAREHEAAEDDQHQAARTASAAAQAPLTPPKQAKTNTKTHRRTPPPAKPAAAHTRNRGRTH
ncbi:hypothetical protein IU459_34980 [Nocardia amamiensis]|uniref:Uncharacterized protein n=1 Tax=Nocardia amamiensis TaxID=404578 RepID=A0ABS0D6B6_9NOCA|nr:hypothetical protein [Nocardia amamiensis]MBF6302699.1 hypothetical protein [Nocardia amamiensis]